VLSGNSSSASSSSSDASSSTTSCAAGSAGVGAFAFGFALAKELKRLLFSRLGGAGLPEVFEVAWELVVEDDWDFESSGLLASAFAGGASFCSGRLAGTVDSIEGLGLAAGTLVAGVGAEGGRAPVLRWNMPKLDCVHPVEVIDVIP
jgi:hypothetical protein